MGPFLAKIVERTKNMKIGNPNHEDTKVGATISEEQAMKVLTYVDIAKKEVISFIYIHIYSHSYSQTSTDT